MAICGAFHASSAIRCSFVETLSRVCVLFIFLSSDSHARLVSPSLHGVPWAWFPRFIGTMRSSDASSFVPLHFVSFDPRYHRLAHGSLAALCTHRSAWTWSA